VTIDLLIAGRRIRLQSAEGVALKPDERFSAFAVPSDVLPFMFIDTTPYICADVDPGSVNAVLPFLPADTEPDLVVDVEPGAGEIPAGAVKVFDAQLMEEVPGGVRNSGEPFWEVFRDDEAVRARVFLKDAERSPVLEMPHGKMRWRIFAGILPARPDSGLRSDQVLRDSSDSKSVARPHTRPVHDKNTSDLLAEYTSGGISDITVDPLPWPLDGLLLYFLFSRAGDIMIHGSGVVAGDRGWLFTGRSGSGKTTLARIFDGAGDRVIHDDRLVLRREGTGWVMHSTPVYRNDEPRSVLLGHLWIIRHGAANVSEPVAGAEAVALILANCIQQNWDGEAASRLAAAAEDLVSSVKISRLSFVPDSSIRDYLLLRKAEDKTLTADTASVMLGEQRSVTLTAGGYSMWPAIRPGDTVVIEPGGARLPVPGEIVALRRDGGYVIHRVTEVTSGEEVSLIHTQGDAVILEDEPSEAAMVAGVVKKVIRSGRVIHQLRRLLPRQINRLTALIASALCGRSR
jgi:energy-coupling factor transporter ATP-binding protein EcfA2